MFELIQRKSLRLNIGADKRVTLKLRYFPSCGTTGRCERIRIRIAYVRGIRWYPTSTCSNWMTLKVPAAEDRKWEKEKASHTRKTFTPYVSIRRKFSLSCNSDIITLRIGDGRKRWNRKICARAFIYYTRAYTHTTRDRVRFWLINANHWNERRYSTM